GQARPQRRRGGVSFETVAGRYEIERTLGRGGMASVYLARDGALQRPVALKVLAGDLGGDGSFRERFLREARLAARLSAPNVARRARGEAGFRRDRSAPGPGAVDPRPARGRRDALPGARPAVPSAVRGRGRGGAARGCGRPPSTDGRDATAPPPRARERPRRR